MQTMVRFGIMCVMGLVVVLACSAESLWCEGAQTSCLDTRAHVAGDLLTVLVFQQSTSTTQAKHATSKSGDLLANGGAGLFGGFPGFSVSGNRSSSGNGSAQSSTVIVDRLTVKVTGVQPNGCLMVAGERTMKLEKDEMTMRFSGTVRAQDVAPDNTIDSVLVADQRLEMTGKGPIAEKQRPGLLTTILSWLW